MKKISTVQTFKSEIFKEQKLTIGLDLGDRWSFYCVRDEAGQVILEEKLPTTPEAMKQTFGKIPRSLIALETGTHSPWVSRVNAKVKLVTWPSKPVSTRFRGDFWLRKNTFHPHPGGQSIEAQNLYPNETRTSFVAVRLIPTADSDMPKQ